MSTVKLAWKKRINGRFLGTFLSVLSNRIFLDIRRDRSQAMWCVQGNGKEAWEREYELDEIDHFFPHAGSLYLGGTKARKLQVETGATLAENDLGAPVLIRPPTSSGPVYILGGMAAPKALLGLHPDTLQIEWQWQDPEYVAHGGQLCRYCDGVIHTVDLKTMEVRRVRHPRPLGFHGHSGNDVWCHFEQQERFGISTVTGEVVWHQREKEPGLHVSLTFLGDMAYCGGPAISAVDLKTGALRWRHRISGEAGRPHVYDGRLYAATKGGMVYVLDAGTGELVASHELGDEPTAVAALPPDRVVVGTYKLLYCLELG
jgi:outer membrane protein assembly factor BamB